MSQGITAKKGESLVEVIVALGIFAFVFMGVVNIVAGSVTLNVSARQRMEVVAMVQRNLNRYLASNTNAGFCTISSRATNPVFAEMKGIDPITDFDIPGTGCKATALTNSTQVCYWMELTNLDASTTPSEVNAGLGLNNTNFIKVVSHGRWYTRILGQQEFTLSRVIRNN